jgi:hypothetical protein
MSRYSYFCLFAVISAYSCSVIHTSNTYEKDFLKKIGLKKQFEPKTTKTCKDPAVLELQTMQTIHELEIMLKNLEMKKDVYEFRYLKHENITDKSGCNISQHICPFKYARNERNDRYPRVITIVQCTCDRCAILGPSFHCQSAYMEVGVLIRDKCDKSGIFEWKKSMEIVPKHCICKN